MNDMLSLPLIAIVGRPNVGKSTLFNVLTKKRDALVANQPGLTRDRRFGLGQVGDRPYQVIDTGGLDDDEDPMIGRIEQQALLAVTEADKVLFMVDGREGLSAQDEEIAMRLRTFDTPIHLVINKVEGFEESPIHADFHRLGFASLHLISAAHRRGIDSLMNTVLADMPDLSAAPKPKTDKGTKVAVLGRPNVGKSTLINRILGEERQLTFDAPGTTRDSISIPFERDNKQYTLIDTAGVRRRARVHETIEKFSVIKALQAMEAANVVIMVLDAQEGMTDQDSNLLGMVMDSGRALVIAVNKWDGLSHDAREQMKYNLERKLHFIDYAAIQFISAKHGTGVGDLFPLIQKAWQSAIVTVPTSRLNTLLQDIYEQHPPPMINGRRIKLRYMHQTGQNPPRFTVFGNQVDRLPDSYKRYISNRLRQTLALMGTPIKLVFEKNDNPYKDKPNKLTPHQEKKRQRMLQHVKKKKR